METRANISLRAEMCKRLIPVPPLALSMPKAGSLLKTGNDIPTARNRLDVVTAFHLLAAPRRLAERPLLAPAGRCPLVAGAVANAVGTFFVGISGFA